MLWLLIAIHIITLTTQIKIVARKSFAECTCIKGYRHLRVKPNVKIPLILKKTDHVLLNQIAWLLPADIVLTKMSPNQFFVNNLLTSLIIPSLANALMLNAKS